jgi:predicted PurR-regulated permease PerM
MIEVDEKPAVTVGEEARQRHLEDDLRDLVDHGLAYAKAEVEWQKARVGYATGRVRSIAVLGLVAFLLAFVARVALTVGLVIGLTPLIGAIGATLAVFGVLILIAAICALSARGQWRRMMAALSSRETA